MEKILIIGATGFIGGQLARALLAKGFAVRGLARNPARAQDLAAAGCEIVQGDMTDLASLERAMEGVEAIYISVQTLSRRQAGGTSQDFMDIERRGLQNIVTACQTRGIHRLIYVTTLGIAPAAPSAWLRGRWEAEEFLLHSGLDVTIIRPGQVIGMGGGGFDLIAGLARRPVTLCLGDGRQKLRNIAVDDLLYYLVGVLDDPRTYGQRYEVGCDDIVTYGQMMDVTAEVLGRPHPLKIHIPLALLRRLAPLIERVAQLPAGSMKAGVDSLGLDLIGDPMPIRAVLPSLPLSYRQAVERALKMPGAPRGIQNVVPA